MADPNEEVANTNGAPDAGHQDRRHAIDIAIRLMQRDQGATPEDIQDATSNSATRCIAIIRAILNHGGIVEAQEENGEWRYWLHGWDRSTAADHARNGGRRTRSKNTTQRNEPE